MGKKRKQQGGEDQYGEMFSAQDKQEQFSFAKSQGGGGTAGRSGPSSGVNVQYQRHLPKFLQPYAYMLGKGAQNEGETTIENTKIKQRDISDEPDEDEEAQAFKRALEERPELQNQVEHKILMKVKAEEEKDQGNQAFKAKDYEKAVKHFSNCIQMNPKSEIFLGNRSAAYLQLGQYQEALGDAKLCTQLNSKWAKGWARMGEAQFKLQQFTHAEDSYREALKLEPDSEQIKEALYKAQTSSNAQKDTNQYVFVKKSKADSKSQQHKQQKIEQKKILSFNQDDDDEQN